MFCWTAERILESLWFSIARNLFCVYSSLLKYRL